MAVSVTPTLISEDQLRSLSRNAKQSVLAAGSSREEQNKLISLADSLFFTASVPDLLGSHRIASWNAVCAFIAQSSTIHGKDELSGLNLVRDFWERGLIFYLDQAPSAKPKSTRQLLVTLTAAAKRHIGTDQCVRSALRDVVKGHLHLLYQHNDHGKVRALTSALAQFLSRDILSIHALVEDVAACPYSPGVTGVEATFEQLLLVLFRCIAERDLASAVGSLVAALLDKFDTGRHSAQSVPAVLTGRPVWTSPLMQVAQTSELDSDSLRTYLLPILFNRNVTDYGAFLRIIGIQSLLSLDGKPAQSTYRDLLLVSLQAGKEAGLLYEADVPELHITANAILLPVNAIASLLCEVSYAARLTGLSLLITSHSATRPLLRTSFTLIRRHLPHAFADTDASFRGEVFSLVQRLLDRLRAASAVLARQPVKAASRTAGGSHADNMLDGHKRFLLWLLKCIAWQLRPTAAYQRHISALKCLSIIVRSGVDGDVDPKYLSKSAQGHTRWPFSISLHNITLQRLLLDLAVDPFDDVRQSASGILMTLCASERHPKREEMDLSVRRALARAEHKMLTTGRADQADGVSHLFHLLSNISPTPKDNLERRVEELSSMISIAERNLQYAVEKYPLHGLLLSIARVSEDCPLTGDLFLCLASSLRRVWLVVKPVLCDDAPEGYLPETVEEVSGVTTKDTLSFSWRALKEASVLLGKLISVAGAGTDLDAQVQSDLYSLCFEQLADLRHRGAFSTVAQTWTLCCGRIAAEKSRDGDQSLEVWYEKLLAILRSRMTINTRRSAGLPSLLCGILVAEEHDHLFKRSFEDLQTIARQPVERQSEQESSLIQVHAMNCLKDVLKTSKLGEKSESFLPAALQLAADALQSKAWAARNCGLMLFRGVIDRLLGTSHAYLEEDEDFAKPIIHQQSRLFQVVLGLLSVSQNNSPNETSTSIEGVFPALQLLQQLQLSGPQLAVAKERVGQLLGSPAWHVRDKAARTYASLIGGSGVEELRDLMGAEPTRHNAWHGKLLCARYTIARLSIQHKRAGHCEAPEASSLCQQVLHILVSVPQPASTSSIIQGAWLDIVVEFLALWQLATTDETLFIALQDFVAALDLSSRLYAHVQATGPVSHLAHVSRMATARALALSLCVGISVEAHNLSTLVVRLCSLDGDTAADFFDTVCNHLGTPSRLAFAALAPVQEACGHVLAEPSLSMEAKMMAQKFLLAASQRWHEVSGACAIIPRACLKPSLDQRQYVNNNLQLRLVYLNSAVQYGTDTVLLIQDISRLVQDLEAAGDDKSYGLPFSREAATHGLATLPLDALWAVIRDESPIRDRLASVLYDLLHDDDEDVRLQAANAAAKLQGVTVTAIPPVAARNLLPFLLSDVNNVLDRAFSDLSTSVAHSLTTLLDHDTALFAEEKQNLYIDTAQQVNFWSRCALKLAPETVSPSDLKRLSTWTLEGLVTLKQYAETEHDGPLGWTSEPDIFTLGLRVFHAAELLLSWSQQGRRVHVRPSSLRRLLGEMALAGEKADLNCIWLEETNRVWKDAVFQHLRRVTAHLEGGIEGL